MSALAIIPARGGSKRIPRKNIRLFCGKPIIAYSIIAALKSGRFDEIMVSTDDEEIASIAREYGAVVPFMRSAKTANDYATLFDVVEEVIFSYGQINRKFDQFCCILPTAPLIDSSYITNSWKQLSESPAVVSAVRFGYPIWRALIEKNGAASMIWPEYLHSRSQDLPSAFHDAGLFYWLNTDIFLSQKTFFPEGTKLCEIPEIQVQDIDTESDWQIAEFKYRYLMERDFSSEIAPNM